jgi:hypothetical protein
VYEHVSANTKNQVSRTEFFNYGLALLRDGQIEHIAIQPVNLEWYRFISPQYVPIQITYYTRNLGSFSEYVTVPIVREKSEWRIEWDWELFHPGLPNDGKLETTVSPAKRGSIIANDNRIRTSDFPSYMVYVTPGLVERTQEGEMLKILANLFYDRIPESYIHHRYIFNTNSEFPVAIGVLPLPLDDLTKAKLLSFQGVSLTPAFGRQNIFYYEDKTEGHVENTQYLECCTRLYSTTVYDGMSGLEKEFNATLKGINGGSLVIKDKNGKVVRTILESKKKDGMDIKL